jgi:hypothetical protein
LGQTSATAQEDPKVKSWDDDPFYVVSMGVHKSRRYHSDMCSFYQRLSNLVLGSNAILGASAFIVLLGGSDSLLAKILVGIVAAGSALDNVLGFAKKAQLHADLSSRFTQLAANMALWDANEQNRRKAVAERLKIEKNEPPLNRLIDLKARNEEMRCMGYGPENMVPLSRCQRIFGYVATFDMRRLEGWQANQRAKGVTERQ